MLFYQIEPLKAREVFGFQLVASQPLVVLIGCGPDVERPDAGDEPLGPQPLISLCRCFRRGGGDVAIHGRWAGAAFSGGFPQSERSS